MVKISRFKKNDSFGLSGRQTRIASLADTMLIRSLQRIDKYSESANITSQKTNPVPTIC